MIIKLQLHNLRKLHVPLGYIKSYTNSYVIKEMNNEIIFLENIINN
jgi:hypothetical protein